MSIFDTILNVIAPYDCLDCGAEGPLLCARCADRLAVVPERCYRCRRGSPGAATCATCRPASRLARVQVATVYRDTAKALIWKLKLAGAQSAAALMAHRLAPLIAARSRTDLIVPVPTATSRVRQRGYDQARLLGRELSRQTGRRAVDCLARHGQAHQHGLDRRQRLTQLSEAFRVTRPALVRGGRIILVDDVMTTGATLEAAAAALRAAGAVEIEAAVFAQPD